MAIIIYMYILNYIIATKLFSIQVLSAVWLIFIILIDKTNKTPVRGIELDDIKSYFAFSRLLQVSNKINKQLLEYGTVRFDQDVQCITADKDFLYIAFIGTYLIDLIRQ